MIHWESPHQSSLAPSDVTHWLQAEQHAQSRTDGLVTDRIVSRFSHDPAYVQSLRLLTKERAVHAKVAGQLTSRFAASPERTREKKPLKLGRLARVVRGMSIRFALSCIMLSDMVSVQLWEMASESTDDAALRDAATLVSRDRVRQAAFMRERLTMEFSDFNFIRRNLRRLRLRLMFSLIALLILWRHRRFIRQCGRPLSRMFVDSRAHFETALELIAPYKRDRLVQLLLSQREHPYGEPPKI